MSFKNTREVARILGINSSRLARAIWDQRIDPPAKGPGGAYIWERKDIIRAGWFFLGRDVSGELAEGDGND